MKKNNTSWQKVKLGDIADINKSVIGKGYKYEDIDYIDISSVGAGELNKITSYQIKKAPGRAKRLVQDGDIIMSTVRPNRRLFLRIKNPQPNLIVSTGFAVISPKNKISRRFLYYLLTNNSFIQYLSSNVKGSAYPAVGIDIFENAEFLIPAKDSERSRIASILSVFDDKIELNNKINATLEKMAQEIFREWFVKFNFPVFVNAPRPLEGGGRLEVEGEVGLGRPKVVNSADKVLYAQLEEKAKEMRNKPTEAEKILWEELRDNKLSVKFRRQHVINKFIADFYCVSAGLVIEVDGEVHKHQQERDNQRDTILRSWGCRILRFKNEEVLENLPVVLQKITTAIKSPLGDLGALENTGLGYKDSGGEMVDSELGEIPKGWEAKKISDVAKINKGLSYTSEEIKDNNGGIPMINLANFSRGGGFKIDGIKFYSGEYNNSNIVKSGDIIIALTDLTSNREVIGHPARVPEVLGWDNIVISLDVCSLETDMQLKEFIYYMMLQKSFSYLMASVASGTNVSHLSKTNIDNFQFIFPTEEFIGRFHDLIRPFFSQVNKLTSENNNLVKLRDLLLPKLMKGEVRV